MPTILTVVHIAVCFFMVIIVLLQHGKGADVGASFGGSSQSLFGTEGPVPLMNKITTMVAIVFMVTSVSLAYISSTSSTGSLMNAVQQPSATEEVAVPAGEKVIPMPAGITEEPAAPEAKPAQE
ncbi:MAG: preprotein translocase subunit SecG [Proteobacteria bacterium]|nr:preprotein translocase subunit SecG [Pseudomonadota bacterium]MBU1057568.1 preprotein translocase subunit SecG [Pseudomonadota bacterium]